MNIAIDARPLSHNLTGIGRYLHQTIIEILKFDDKNHYFLYSDREIIPDFSDYKNVTIRTKNNTSSALSTIIAQIYFPIWSQKDHINTFWSPRHHLPLLLSKDIKKILTIHDIVWIKCPETMSKMGALVERFLFPASMKLSDKIITLSEFTKNELKENFKYKELDITVSGAGFFNNTFSKKMDSTPIYKDDYILFVGTLEPRKNLPNLIKAFRETSIKHPKLKLIIVGKKGWGDIAKENLNEEDPQLKNKIITLGFVDDKTLSNLYQYCTLLAMPSIYEGYGLPAMEALYYKKKVIVPWNSGIPELKVDDNDNIYITEVDASSIKETLNKALKSTPLDYVKIKSSWEETAKITYKILTDI